MSGYNLLAVWAFAWFVAAILGAIFAMESAGPGAVTGSAANTVDFLDAALNPEQVGIDQPTVGSDDQNIVSTVWNTANLAKDWLVFAANSALLNHGYFTGWLVIIQLFLLVPLGVFMVILGLRFVDAFGNLVGGVGSVIGRILP